MKEGDLFAKTPLVDRGVSTLPPANLPGRKRCDLSMNLHPPPNPHPFLAGGLAGASSNDHAAAKLSRQTLMRCAALLASHPCHPSPPPEPFLSPGAGDSSAHGRHLGLKMAFAYPLQLKLDQRAQKPAGVRIFGTVCENWTPLLVWPLLLCFECVCVPLSVGLCGGVPHAHTAGESRDLRAQ